MSPPVFRAFREEGGGEDDHKGRDSPELMVKHLKVGVTVLNEVIHVVVVSFEQFWDFHKDRFDP